MNARFHPNSFPLGSTRLDTIQIHALTEGYDNPLRMKRRLPLGPAGFSLVEVTLALGVAAFCLIALLGLLPLGMQTNQSAVSQTAAASILSSLVADLRATARSNPTSPQYDITFGTAKLLYVDDQGRVVTPANSNAAPRFR